MSWSELERLVRDSNVDVDLRRTMDRCQSHDDLIAAATNLGYQITPMDVLKAWQDHPSADMPNVSGG